MDGHHYIVPVKFFSIIYDYLLFLIKNFNLASCNNLAMVKFLVDSGACLFASTLSDHETPAEKCEEDEEGFDGCSEYLYSKFHLKIYKKKIQND